MKISEMLKEEVKRTTEFSKVNFGSQGGDGFPEFAQDVMDNSAQILIANFAVDSLKQSMPGTLEKLTTFMEIGAPAKIVVSENRSLFHTYLLMIYWGIQIGRRLEREQNEVLKNMETRL